MLVAHTAHCCRYFSEQGVAIGDRKSGHTVTAWPTRYLASCATIKHPNSRTRRIGLFKVRDPATRVITWHLFKYYFTKVDNMSDCFRFIVDCSLRDIGRAYAAQMAQRNSESRSDDSTAVAMTPPRRAAWGPNDHVPPPYDEVSESSTMVVTTNTRRRLTFSSDAEAEAADLAVSAGRAPAYSRHPDMYMDVSSTAY